MFVGVKRAGARHAALHFVQRQHQVVLVGKIAQPLHEFLAGRTDTAFALHGFHQEARRIGADRRFRAFEIVEIDIAEAGQQWIEALVHLFLIGRADRRHGATVKRVLEGDDLEAFVIAFMLVIGADRLDRAFHRFRARIGEEHRVGKGFVDQQLRQFLALRTAI